MESLLAGTMMVLPASRLIRGNHSKEDLLQLLARMTVIAEKERSDSGNGVRTKGQLRDA